MTAQIGDSMDMRYDGHLTPKKGKKPEKKGLLRRILDWIRCMINRVVRQC